MRETVITSSVLIVIISALRYLLRGKISPRLQYALWGLVLLRLMLPFSLVQSPVSVMNVLPEAAPVYDAPPPVVNVGGAVPDIQPGGVEVQAPQPAVSQPTPVDWALTARYVWIGGAAAMGLWMALCNLRFYAKLKRTRREFEDAQCEGLRVYVADGLPSPCLYGLFRPCVYLTPESVGEPERLRHILTHELTHMRHLDNLWSVLRGLCLCVYWFDPLVWLAAALSRRDCELACDESAIKELGEEVRLEYGRTLVNMLSAKRDPAALLRAATTMTGGKRSLKERVSLIAQKPKMAAYTLAAVLIVAAIAAGCTFTGAEEVPEGAPVFTRLEDVSYITIRSGPSDTLIVDEEHRDEMLEWLGAFTLGERQKRTDKPAPGTNSCSVILAYKDDSSESSGIDITVRDGVAYYIVRPDLPDCWDELWADAVEVQELADLLLSLTAGDIKYIDYESVDAQTLAPLQSKAPGQRTERELGLGFHWSVWAYLDSTGEGTYSSKEAIKIYAGLERDMVGIDYRGASILCESPELYALVSTIYDTEYSVDAEAWEKLGGILRPYMQDRLLGVSDIMPNAMFRSSELTSLELKRTYGDMDGGTARLYEFHYALVCDKPENIMWAGGAVLDSQLRYKGFDLNTHLAALERDGEVVRSAFLPYDIFRGEDEAAREANARSSVAAALQSGGGHVMPGVDAPASIVTGAALLAESQYESTRERFPEYGLTDWRVTSLEKLFDYEDLDGWKRGLYSLNFEFLMDPAEPVTLDDGRTVGGEGWVALYPDCWFV